MDPPGKPTGTVRPRRNVSEPTGPHSYYKDQHCAPSAPQEGLGWRVSLSIISGVLWLSFLILYLAFFADEYSIYYNIAVFLLSILVIIGVLCIPWAFYGFRHASEKEREMWKVKGFKVRVMASISAFVLLMLILIFWLFFYAEDYTGYQNLAVFLVMILIFGGIMGSMWASWGIRYAHQTGDDKKDPRRPC